MGRLLVVSLMVVIGLIFSINSAYAATVTVCDSGCDSTTIQGGVDLANSDDTVLVYPNGSSPYTEKNINITKPLTIEGTSREDVVLVCSDGTTTCDVSRGNDGVMRINTADNVTIRNMTIKNTWWGISLDSQSAGARLVAEELTFSNSSDGDCIDSLVPFYENTTYTFRNSYCDAWGSVYFVRPSQVENNSGVFVYNNTLVGAVLEFKDIETVEFKDNFVNLSEGDFNLFGMENVEVENNLIILPEYAQFQIIGVDGAILNKNTISMKNDIQIFPGLSGGEFLIITDNNITCDYEGALTTKNYATIVIDSNTIQKCPYAVDVSAHDSSSNVTISGNRIIDSSYQAMGLWGSGGKVTVSDNTVNSGTVEIRRMNKVNIVNNTLTDYYYGVDVFDSQNVSISDNNISTEFSGIYLKNIVDVVIDKNSVSEIYSDNSSDVVIRNNQIDSPRYEGIYLDERNTDFLILNNTITSEGLAISAVFNGIENLSIMNNHIMNSDQGIQIWGVDITIYNNTISNISGDGITDHGCKNSEDVAVCGQHSITANTIEQVNGLGVHFAGANGTVFSNNHISNSSTGIYVQSGGNLKISSNNLVENDIGFHIDGGINIVSTSNNFINNTDQAIDNGVNNVWDDGSIGNFWSNWTTPDNNKDGIVDVPRLITGSAGSYDNFPLTGEVFTEINTPAGDNVTVGFEGNSSIEFDTVASEGTTALTFLGKVGNKTPTHYKIDVNNVYDISTTAEYSGNITIAIHYNASGTFTLRRNQNESEDVKLFHYDPSVDEWFDVTSSVDIVNDIVYAVVDHLSIYGVGVLRTVDELPEIILSLGLDNGIETSLLAKVEGALAAREKGNDIVASNKLQAFIHEVEALSGKKIAGEDADTLVAIAG